MKMLNKVLKRLLTIGLLSVLTVFAFDGCATSGGEAAASSGGMTLDQALKEAADRIDERIAAGAKIAPLNFNSQHDRFSFYVLDELTANLVDSRKLTVVDRREVELIRSEFDFQFSGEVGDDSMQQLGRMLGAQSIISGSLTDMGGFYRIVIRVLNVQNASVEVQYRANIVNDNIMTALLTGGRASVTASAPPRTPAAQTPAVQTSAVQAPTAPTRAHTPAQYEATPVQVQTPVTPAPAVQVPAQAPAPAQVYRIGDTGPAGGIIFFDKGNNSGGWRYLEAAPASTEVRELQWSVSGFNTGANGIEPGTGRLNTRNIMDASVQAAVNAPAARYCNRLQYGGYNDWYLPSRNELGLMYMNLKVDGIGGFGGGWYWSSTQIDERGAHAQNFNNGAQTGPHTTTTAWKTNSHSVRAIRQF